MQPSLCLVMSVRMQYLFHSFRTASCWILEIITVGVWNTSSGMASVIYKCIASGSDP
jgi:hypothetical protein